MAKKNSLPKFYTLASGLGRNITYFVPARKIKTGDNIVDMIKSGDKFLVVQKKTFGDVSVAGGPVIFGERFLQILEAHQISYNKYLLNSDSPTKYYYVEPAAIFPEHKTKKTGYVEAGSDWYFDPAIVGSTDFFYLGKGSVIYVSGTLRTAIKKSKISNVYFRELTSE